MTDVRLRAITPNGSPLGPLPAPQGLDASYVLNDTGALSFQYPLDAPLSSLLGQPLEIVTEVSTDDGLTWTEPPNGRFLYWNDARDPVKADAFSADCPSYVQRLTKALVPFTGLDSNGQRTFTNATPGKILNDLLSEAQTRGALAGISWTFGATVDTAGYAWPAGSLQTLGFSPGQDFYMILTGLADAGLVDFRMNGRELQVYAADSANGMAGDRTILASAVTLRPGQGLTEAPFRRTWAGLADTAYIQGDGTANLIRTNGAAITPWGRQEMFVTAGGATTAGTLQVVGDGALALTDDVRVERTYGLTFASAVYQPFGQYHVGEYVYGVSEGTTAPERMRVRQITLTRDANGVSGGNAVLNDRFVEADIRQQRALNKLTGTATQGGTGSTPIGNDILPPAGVGTVTTGSSAYLDLHGDIKATLVLDWPDVTTNSDGTPIGDLDHYEVHRRRSGETTWTKVAEVNTSQWSDSPYEPNETWEFRVCAVDSVYNRGAFSATVAKTTASDVTGPVAPSQPSGSSSPANAAAIVVGWDGKNSVGGAMDADLDYVEVHVSTTSGFTATGGSATTLKATLLPGPGSVTIAGLVEGTTYFVVLKGRDTSGNYGAQSVQRSVVASRRTDGAAPSAPPANTALLQFAVGGLEAKWDAVTNADPVTYDVYLEEGAPVAAFNSTTFLGSTAGTRFGISRKADGSALVADTDYYVAVKARDADGTATGQGTAGPTQYRKADVATISASWAYLGQVEAEQIRSGLLDADVIVGSSITAGDGVTERMVSLTPDGLLVTDSGGSPVVSIPTSLTSDISINANILAKTLTADGLATLNNVTISKGKNITLLKGIAEPGSPIQLSNSYPTVPLTNPAPVSGILPLMGAASFEAGAGNILVGWNDQGPGDAQTVIVQTINRTTGATVASLFATATATYADQRPSGIVKIGSFIYIMRMDGPGQFWVEKYNTSGVLQSRWAWGTTSYYPVMGLDGANIVVAYVEGGTNLVKFCTRNPDTGALVGSIISTGGTQASLGVPVAVIKATTDLPVGAPAARVIITTTTGNRVYTTAGVRETNSEWPLDGNGDGPMIWDSVASQFKHLSQTLSGPLMAFHNGDVWSGAMTRSVKGSATLYDSNATGGTHETAQGPVATLAHAKRANIFGSIDSLPGPSVPPTNDDVTGWRFFLGTGSGTRLTQYLVGTTTGSAVLGQRVANVPGSGTNPPSLNNFPSAVAAKITDSTGNYYFDALGDAKVDDLTANTFALTTDLALTTVTPVAPWVLFGTAGYLDGCYAKRNGVVYLEGLVKSGAAGTTIFILPVGCRPSNLIILPVMIQATATGAASAGTAHTHTTSNQVGRLNILPTGVVQLEPTGGAMTTTYLALAGSFIAEQ